MATKVAGDLYESITGQLFEIGRQLRQQNGYPFNPEELKRHLQSAIEGRFFFDDSKKLLLTKLFDPAKFLDKGWTTWKGPSDGDGLSGDEDVDPRSLAFSEIEVGKFLFETCLEEGEKRIAGEEKFRRLKERPDFIRFGGNVFLALWEDYQANKKSSILEWLYQTQKVSFMDFFGTILRGPHGSRIVLYLCRCDGGRWRWSSGWLGHVWAACYPSVGCASQP